MTNVPMYVQNNINSCCFFTTNSKYKIKYTYNFYINYKLQTSYYKQKVLVKKGTLTNKNLLSNVITNKFSRPDLFTIELYWYFRSWYSSSKLQTPGIYINYNKLADKYNCSTSTVKRAIIKLEKLGLVQRSFQHTEHIACKSYNKPILYVWKDTPIFYNPHGVFKSDVETLVPSTNHKYVKERYGIDFASHASNCKISDEWWEGMCKFAHTKESIKTKVFIRS